jgi:hypothetical protein
LLREKGENLRSFSGFILPLKNSIGKVMLFNMNPKGGTKEKCPVLDVAWFPRRRNVECEM